jgi:hypothetical protein
MRQPSLLIILLLFTSLFACKQKDNGQVCVTTHVDLPASPAFKGFTTADLDTIEFAVYKRNGLFDSNLSTIRLHPRFYNVHDTLFVADTLRIMPFYDYDVYVPAANSRFRLTNVTGSIGLTRDTIIYYGKCPGTSVSNGLISASINGANAHVAPTFIQSVGYFVLIK